jgi:hypothetical protein
MMNRRSFVKMAAQFVLGCAIALKMKPEQPERVEANMDWLHEVPRSEMMIWSVVAGQAYASSIPDGNVFQMSYDQ